MSTPEDSTQRPDIPSENPAHGVPAAQSGAPTQMPHYDSAPATSGEALPPRPSLVSAAFILYIVSAVLSVISGIITIVAAPGHRQSIIDQLNKSGTDLQGHDVHTVADAAIAAAIGFSAVTMVFWVVTFVIFAFYMRSGRNWARIILTILSVLSIFNIFTVAGLLQFIASLVALIFVWLPTSKAWFKELKVRRLPRA